MIYQITFDSQIKTIIQHFSPSLKQKIKIAFKEIAQNPYVGKVLQEELSGLYSYRVLRFRLIYMIDSKKKRIDVVTIGPRSSVYDALEQSLRKNK